MSSPLDVGHSDAEPVVLDTPSDDERGGTFLAPRRDELKLRNNPQVRATNTLILSSTLFLVGPATVWLLLGGTAGVFGVVAASLTVVSMFTRGVFVDRMVPDVTSMVPRIAGSVSIAVVLAIIIEVFTAIDSVEGFQVLVALVALSVLGVSGQACGLMILRRRWQQGKGRSRAAIVGTTDLAVEFAIEIKHHASYGVDVIGFVETDPVRESLASPTLGGLADLPDLVQENQIDRLIVMPGSAKPLSSSLLSTLRWTSVCRGLTTHIVPRFYELGMGLDSLSPDRVRGYPLLRLHRAQQREFGLAMKRLFDIAVAVTGLVLISPLLLATTLAVKLSSRGPVFFRQERVGQFGRPFHVIKFRTMRVSDKSDTEWMGEAEERITPIGNFLRKSSIDELPQLINIVRGEMSLVGPRPERPAFVERFSSQIPDYQERHRMRVGLTGLSQIVGLRGDTPISERVKYDNIYIDQWSFSGDLQILFKTAWAIVRANRYAEKATEIDLALKRHG